MNKSRYKLEELVEYMTKVELGGQPTIRELDTIGSYVDAKKGEMNEEEFFAE